MRILLIEDDPDICQAIEVQLKSEGYIVDICNAGEEALYYALQESHDAIVLDRMLPEIDGLTILQLLRQNQIHTPVLMATAMNSISDRIDGLDAGADDYIVKPFDVRELCARIRALTRRPSLIEDTNQLSFLDLSLEVADRMLSCHGQKVRLSKRESSLLEFFLKNTQKTLNREAIFAHVWGPGAEVEDGNLDNYIYFLRKRLKSLKSQAEIRTIHGAGYQINRLE